MSDQGYPGLASYGQRGTDYNALTFVIARLLNNVRTVVPVQVVACTNRGTLTAPGTVDVTPLVNQLTGGGNAVPHGTVYGMPFLRYQGGGNAVICDPAPGDIGIAAICDRDISSVKANKARANPGSNRKFSLPDGVYLGGILTAALAQSIVYTPTGIVITDKNGNSINMGPSGIAIVTAGIFTVNGVNVGQTHVHGGVAVGAADTGVPM